MDDKRIYVRNAQSLVESCRPRHLNGPPLLLASSAWDG